MRWAWASLVFVAAGAASAQTPDPFDLKFKAISGKGDPAKADERLLVSKNLKIDDASLLQFFRDRTLNKTQIDALKRKVKDLGAVAYKDRDQAMNDLVAAGSKARPVLLQVVKDDKEPLETIRRVELCLRKVQDDSESALAAAAVRTLAKRKPAGTVEVLLNHVPFAPGPEVIEAIQEALPTLARNDKHVQDTLIKALSDSQAVKRGLAGAVLVRSDGFAKIQKVDQLLKDPDPQVRFQVAKAYLQAKNKAAVPVLIDLIAALPTEDIWQVEEMLGQIAGEKGPHVYVDPDHEPATVRDAWKAWWQTNRRAVDLTKVDPNAGQLGLTLITQMDNGKIGKVKVASGRVFEVNSKKEIIWEIKDLNYPFDAQVVGKDRVLIAEYLGRRVTERDLKGKIIWEKQVDMPIGVQRLPDGKTFIATRNQLLIVDRSGKAVFTYVHQSTSIMAARRLRNGQMIVVSSGGMLDWLDAKGRIINSFQTFSVRGGGIDVLPGGNVLVPATRENQVVEFDRQGKPVWQVSVPAPISVAHLANGNILVVTLNREVLEWTRDGREVWSYKTDGRTWRAWKR